MERALSTPPTVQLDQARRTRFLRVFNRAWLSMGGLALASMPFYPTETAFFAGLIGVTGLTYVAVSALARKGKQRMAGVVFCVVVNQTFYALMIANYYRYGFNDLEAVMTRVSALALMGSSIVFAGALISEWAAPAFALLNTALLVLAVLLVDSRLGPKVSVPFYWWLLALAVWLYERQASGAISVLRNNARFLEQAVEKRTRDLRETVRKLESAHGELQNANSELETFSYSVAHDLRAPLRRIDGFSSALAEDCSDALNEQCRSHLDVIRAQARRMDELINALLDLSRVSRAPLHLVQVNLSDLAWEIARTLDQQDPSRKIAWEIAQDLHALADLALTRVVLENLLGNAWKFTSKAAQPRIEMGSSLQADRLAFFVRDNGVGFDMTYARQLFQPFQRLHTASDFSGTGIGLATVHRIIQRHGGRIRADGAVGMGATFTFTFG